LADGQYRFDGVQCHVALTEPEKHGAIHGFLRWQAWHVMRTSTATVAMEVGPHPMEGHPFLLDVEVDRSLDGDRLTVTTAATNAGVGPCAYGADQHPYLSPGVGLVDPFRLQLEAGARIGSDDERHLPTGAEAVDRTIYDARESCLPGPTALDFAFTDLNCGATGRAWARLGGTDGGRAKLWVDESYPTIEFYAGDTLAPGRRRSGLGAEPMPCPTDAAANVDALTRLEPGQSVYTPWGARLP